MLDGLFKRGKGEFLSVADVASERGCDVRTVMALSHRGVLPPLLGNQCGLASTAKGWDRTYWTEWYKQQAQAAVEEDKAARDSLGVDIKI